MATDWFDGRIARRRGHTSAARLAARPDRGQDPRPVRADRARSTRTSSRAGWSRRSSRASSSSPASGSRRLERGVVMQARDLGKLKTWSQAIAAGLGGLAAAGALDRRRVAWWALLVALVLTWVSGLDYARVAPGLLRDAAAGRREPLPGSACRAPAAARRRPRRLGRPRRERPPGRARSAVVGSGLISSSTAASLKAEPPDGRCEERDPARRPRPARARARPRAPWPRRLRGEALVGAGRDQARHRARADGGPGRPSAPTTPLTQGELAELVAGLTQPDRARPATPDRRPVDDRRPRRAARRRARPRRRRPPLFTAAPAHAGLAPPARFGTEVVARLLGLRTNHPAAQDDLELLPGRPRDPRRGGLLGRADPPLPTAGRSSRVDATPRRRSRSRALDRLAAPHPHAPPFGLVGFPYVWGGDERRRRQAPFGVAGPGRLRLLGLRLARLQAPAPTPGPERSPATLRGRTTLRR